MQQKICTAGMLPRVIIKRGRTGAISLQECLALFEHTLSGNRHMHQAPPGQAFSGSF
jgi:hypothetical protein